MTTTCAPLGGVGPCDDSRAYLCQVAQAAFALLFHEAPEREDVLRFLQATSKHFGNAFGMPSMGEVILWTGGEYDAVLAIWIAGEIRDMAEDNGSVDFLALGFDPRSLGCREINV